MRRAAASLLPLVIACCAIGCSDRPNQYETAKNQTNPPPTSPNDTTPPPPEAAPMGSTADSASSANPTTSNTPTPMDQAENSADRTITQGIRQALVADPSLSVEAKNVKIITAKGVVTLRGPVKTQTEKSTIVQAAQQVAGVMRVDD